jgi:hypothetical protein
MRWELQLPYNRRSCGTRTSTMNIYGSLVTDEMEKAGSRVEELALRLVN